MIEEKILFSSFNLEKLKEIQKCHIKWEIKERKYENIVLTSNFGIVIIEKNKESDVKWENYHME